MLAELCICLSPQEMDDGEEKQGPGYPAEMLYVVESIALDVCDSSSVADSARPILHSGESIWPVIVHMREMGAGLTCLLVGRCDHQRYNVCRGTRQGGKCWVAYIGGAWAFLPFPSVFFSNVLDSAVYLHVALHVPNSPLGRPDHSDWFPPLCSCNHETLKYFHSDSLYIRSVDPVDVHTYYVVHIDGVYIVTLSWLSKLDMFTAADCKLWTHCNVLTVLYMTSCCLCSQK